MRVPNILVAAVSGAVFGAGAAFALLHFEAPANEIYALNVARVINAERQVISKGEATGNLTGAETELFKVNHALRGIVTGLAGNHLVVVKQAIVSGPYKDITTQTLSQLGLPLNAPKVSMEKMMAQAPGVGLPPLEHFLDKQKLQMAQKGLQEEKSLNQQKTAAALP